MALLSSFCCFMHTPEETSEDEEKIGNQISIIRNKTLECIEKCVTGSSGIIHHSSLRTNELLQQIHILQNKYSILKQITIKCSTHTVHMKYRIEKQTL